MNAATIAVLIPCRNEATTIARQIKEFNRHLPDASIWICDNNSTDDTIAEALSAGATVITEKKQGKGHAVRRLFSEVEADIFVLVDGDCTYDAASAPDMIKLLTSEKLDMVVGIRLSEFGVNAFPRGHRFGNRILNWFLKLLFGAGFTDVLSGYRTFSRRFVKSFPALAAGFETETELTVHALSLHMPTAEVQTGYRPRPGDSTSKLRTWRDGIRILATMIALFKGERPLLFFSIGFVVLAALSLSLGYPVWIEFLHTGKVPRFPTAILAMGIMLLAFLSLTCGFILETVSRGRREMKRLFYLSTRSGDNSA
jgi:glycosyltransferase involved in cell wall biosynthesis